MKAKKRIETQCQVRGERRVHSASKSKEAASLSSLSSSSGLHPAERKNGCPPGAANLSLSTSAAFEPETTVISLERDIEHKRVAQSCGCVFVAFVTIRERERAMRQSAR